MKKLTSGRNELIAKQFNDGATEETLAVRYDIGLTYVKTILRERGLIDKRPREDLSERNLLVRQMFKDGQSTDKIAAQMDLTPTRIRQILGEDNSPAPEQNELIKAKEKALTMIAEGKTAKEIEDVIGLQTVKRLKYRFNFNVFKLVVNKRSTMAQELYKGGMKPADISEKLKCTGDYVYTLLRAAGFKLGISKDAKRLRDKEIYTFVENGGTIPQAAKKWDIGEAMVRIVCEKIGRQPGTKNVTNVNTRTNAA